MNLAGFLLVVVLASCGTEESKSDTPPPAPPTCASLVNAICTKACACGECRVVFLDDQGFGPDIDYADRAQCEADLTMWHQCTGTPTVNVATCAAAANAATCDPAFNDALRMHADCDPLHP